MSCKNSIDTQKRDHITSKERQFLFLQNLRRTAIQLCKIELIEFWTTAPKSNVDFLWLCIKIEVNLKPSPIHSTSLEISSEVECMGLPQTLSNLLSRMVVMFKIELYFEIETLDPVGKWITSLWPGILDQLYPWIMKKCNTGKTHVFLNAIFQ